jgi:hypothetical protein
VPYPKGLMPTRLDRIPAKIIISQALKKKNPPAAGSAKYGLMASPRLGDGKTLHALRTVRQHLRKDPRAS